jgi:hypothetical protein
VGGAVVVFAEECVFEAMLEGDVSVNGAVELLRVVAMVKARFEFDKLVRDIRRFAEECREVKRWWSRGCFAFGTKARTSLGVVHQGDWSSCRATRVFIFSCRRLYSFTSLGACT